MALFEGKTPAERNKMIAGVVLPLVALVFVVRMLSGSGPAKPANPPKATPSPRAGAAARQAEQQPEETIFDRALTPLPDLAYGAYGGGDAGRNIFAFYERPVVVKPPVEEATPTPTPEPPPPLVLASLSPQSVFARTAGFTLQVSGDKFTPATRVYLDSQELQTQYRSPQQLTATVPAALIAQQGQRTVVVRTPDNVLFSNNQALNVMQPPAPTYTFVGLLKRARFNTAVLKDQKGELYSVRAGDLVEGRFRVTEISERSVELVDKDLNVRHTMPFVETRSLGATGGRVPGSIQPPPPPPSDDDGDDEP
ncbi:MAG TPA: TIG domain-containing protein [Pyrinomonadaceae bacterium]|nr:TIG domain-containing protein [Pyrinomonadaceae bacterium]